MILSFVSAFICVVDFLLFMFVKKYPTCFFVLSVCRIVLYFFSFTSSGLRGFFRVWCEL
jgi:hypothetical protein